MTAEEIAAGLKGREEFAIKAILPGTIFGAFMSFELTDSEREAMASLVEKGLARKRWKGWGYTPLGMQVRAILESNHDRA